MLQHFLAVVGLHGFRCLLHVTRANYRGVKLWEAHFLEFDTSVICHAVLILCLGSFLLEGMLLGSKYCLLAFYDVMPQVTPVPAIWIELFASTVRCTNIIFIFVQLFFRDCRRSFTLRKLYVFPRDILIFFCINLIECIQRRNNNLYYGMKLRCSTSTVEIWLWLSINPVG